MSPTVTTQPPRVVLRAALADERWHVLAAEPVGPLHLVALARKEPA